MRQVAFGSVVEYKTRSIGWQFETHSIHTGFLKNILPVVILVDYPGSFLNSVYSIQLLPSGHMAS